MLLAKSVVAKMLGREIVLLPLGSSPVSPGGEIDRELLPLQYGYRASSDGVVTYRILSSGVDFSYEVWTAGHTSGFEPVRDQPWLSCAIARVEQGDELSVNLVSPHVRLNGRSVDMTRSPAAPSRKYVAALELSSASKRLRRSCFHYLPCANKAIGEDYYFGDDYVDYPQQQAAEVERITALIQKFCVSGRLLEIGCAMGVSLASFVSAGFDAYGVDISQFAVAEATKRVGPDRVRQCDVDRSEIPFHGAFDIICLWDVLEHSSNPAGLIEKISAKAAPGASLFLHTSNADSLTHRLLGEDWEGYSDYSHHGVDLISAASLRRWLDDNTWDIVDWQCRDVWLAPIDPTMARLRQVFTWFPELVTMLRERELGDFILVVARKRSAGSKSKESPASELVGDQRS